MSRSRTLSRRTVLRGLGLGGAALALPFTNVLRGHAQIEAPKRLLVVFTPNGICREHWHWAAGGVLEPLAAHQSNIVQLTGLDMNAAQNAPGGGHAPGVGAILTGTRLQDGSAAAGGRFAHGWPSGSSVDQEIARVIGTGTRAESLLLGVGVTSDGVMGRMSYRAADEPIAPENDPRAVFARLFDGVVPDDTTPVAVIDRNQSVLDFLGEEIGELQAAAGAEDRRMLDAHLTALRNTERRLAAPPLVPSMGCEPTMPTTMGDPLDPASYPEMSRAQTDLMVDALACGITNVGTLFYGGNDIAHPWAGVTGRHHDISHSTASSARDQQRLIQRWYTEQFAYLLDRLDAVVDVDGNTLLHNTTVLYVSELSDPQPHDKVDLPILMAGTGGGYFRTGEQIHIGLTSGPANQKGNDSHNDLLVTLMQWAGVEKNVFGDPALCSGALSEILA